MAKKAQVSKKTSKMPDRIYTVEIKFAGSNNFEDIEEFRDEVFTSKADYRVAAHEAIKEFQDPISAIRVTSYHQDTDDANSKPEDELIVGLHHEGTGFEVYKKTTAQEVVEYILYSGKAPIIAKYIKQTVLTKEGAYLFKSQRSSQKKGKR
jgi:hypothetical protein